MVVRHAITAELHNYAHLNLKNNMILKGINDLYQINLVKMILYAYKNRGFKYILTMKNCLMKLAISLLLKTKPVLECSFIVRAYTEKIPNETFTDQ